MTFSWQKTPGLGIALIGLLTALVVLWLSSIPAQIRHDDLIVERAYALDRDHRLQISDMGSHLFTPFEDPLFLGNDKRPLWLRLTLRDTVHTDWVLQIQPAYIQHIEVWQHNDQGGWQRQVIGSRHAWSDREIRTLTPAVPLNPATLRAGELFVKIQTDTSPVAVQVIRQHDNTAFNGTTLFFFGIVCGFAVVMIALSAVFHHVTRERLWAADAVFNVAGLVLVWSQLGLVSSLLLPDARNVVDQLVLYVNAIYVAYAIWFYRMVFGLFQIPKWALLPYRPVFVLFACVTGLIAAGHGDMAMQLNNAYVLVCVLWGFVIIALARHSDGVILWVFRIGYGASLVYFLMWSIPVALHIQTGNVFALYPGLPNNIFSPLLLMSVLMRNTQLRLRADQQLIQAKQAAEQQLAMTKAMHEESSSFFSMLLHEIKNPLAVIRMSATNLMRHQTALPEGMQQRLTRLQQAVNSVDAVLERGTEIDQMVQNSLYLVPREVSIDGWLRDFCQTHPDTRRLHCRTDEPVNARVDTGMLALMFGNLVDNAVKYAAPETPILCRLVNRENQWVLSVTNTVGHAGFPDPARLFTRYYRAPAVAQQSGLGLGLYWVRGIARKMGGDLSYSHTTSTLEFAICLPH